MKIIIANTIVPFIDGGATFIADWLELKMREHGHQVEAVKIPFSSYYKDILTQMLALRLYHLEDECERLICLRMPSYMIPHPQKYLWFLHHYREVYDLWNSNTDSDYLPKNSESIAVKEYIMRADNVTFREARKIYTISKNVSNRLMTFNNIDSTPLYYPLLKPEQFFCESYGDYIYYTSRICVPKRQFLAVEAMKYTKTKVKLLITGRPDTPDYMVKIRKYIMDNSLESKITVSDKWITEEEKAKYFSNCLAALSIPYDEDGYGYVALEAFHSRKAVITCTDSGGVNELIVNGENGWCFEPDPKILAESFDRLYEDRQTAEKMGNLGIHRIDELGITWDNVIKAFTL